MDLLINTFGTRIRSSGERIVLALPGDKAKFKMKKEYPVRALEKIIILRPGVPKDWRDDERGFGWVRPNILRHRSNVVGCRVVDLRIFAGGNKSPRSRISANVQSELHGALTPACAAIVAHGLTHEIGHTPMKRYKPQELGRISKDHGQALWVLCLATRRHAAPLSLTGTDWVPCTGVYLNSAYLAVLAHSAHHRISNLRWLNTYEGFDSHPRLQLLQRVIPFA